MGNKIKLGVIGMSDGNGHPYSWSAICNGYDVQAMLKCPFPVIPKYLSEQNWPEARIADVEVTHIWTQDTNISNDVSNAALIPNVCKDMVDMIGEVDGVLLARDDAENHEKMALPFLEAGLPIFIDKPFATSVADANDMLNAQQFESQIFTCSSLRYAEELMLTESDRKELGEILFVEATVAKKWETYAVHLIDPILRNTPERGHYKSCKSVKNKHIMLAIVQWENLIAKLKITGNQPSSIEIDFYGYGSHVKKVFHDSFACFKSSIEHFITGLRNREIIIPRSETMEVVHILEDGTI